MCSIPERHPRDREFREYQSARKRFPDNTCPGQYRQENLDKAWQAFAAARQACFEAGRMLKATSTTFEAAKVILEAAKVGLVPFTKKWRQLDGPASAEPPP